MTATAKTAKLTFHAVRAELAAIGVTIRPNDWNEYRVQIKGGDDDTAALIDRGHTREDQQFALEEALAEGKARAVAMPIVSPVALADHKAATKAAPVVKYRLGSNDFVHAPGIVAWGINGYHFPRDRARLAKVIAESWSIPMHAAHALLSKRSPYSVDGATVVFEA